MYAGDFNVPLDHDLDTSGYLHTNNNESRRFMKSRIVTNDLADIWRLRNNSVRAYTFDKKQTSNNTKARLDYFLITQTTVRYVTDAQIGRASTLSNHRHVFLTISPSTIPTGQGFWKFDNKLLKDADVITGVSQEIKTVMKRYSSQLQNTKDPKDDNFAQSSWDISNTLLHDTILLEACSYSMKYKAYKAREREMTIRNLRQQIDEVQDSKAEDDIQRLQLLTKAVQDLEDSDELESVTQMLAKYNLEGERPTRLFCSMNKKRRKTAQFSALIRKVVDKQGNKVEETLSKQSKIEEEVHNYYEELYKHSEIEHTYDEIVN